MNADGWVAGGEPTRRCGHDIDRKDGTTAPCRAVVFVEYIGTMIARYVCVNPRCRRFSAYAEARYRKGCEA